MWVFRKIAVNARRLLLKNREKQKFIRRRKRGDDFQNMNRRRNKEVTTARKGVKVKNQSSTQGHRESRGLKEARCRISQIMTKESRTSGDKRVVSLSFLKGQ